MREHSSSCTSVAGSSGSSEEEGAGAGESVGDGTEGSVGSCAKVPETPNNMRHRPGGRSKVSQDFRNYCIEISRQLKHLT